jgi:hypothetical protein
MKRAKVICPFTGRKCMQCSLYRGRHQGLCFYAHFANTRNSRSTEKRYGFGKKTRDYTKNIAHALIPGTLNAASNI